MHDANETIGELSRNYADVVTKLEALLQEKEQLQQALQKADEKLAATALTDSVCGLPNERAFREAMIRDLARADRSRTHIALIVVEIDNLRRITEQAGPTGADQALGIVAEVLLGCIRVSDVIARVGAETFAMLLPNTSLQGALVVAERACKRVAESSFSTPSGAFHVTASIGLAATMGPQCRDQADALLAAAENGLVMAKNAGRNRVMVGSL
jgi:diguanylate cyclase (GGDEF)-like protein